MYTLSLNLHVHGMISGQISTTICAFSIKGLKYNLIICDNIKKASLVATEVTT
jgi:hypothetical protein